MYISPISAFTPARNINRQKANKNSNISFSHREEIIVSQNSQKILDHLFHAFFKAKQELGNTKIATSKGFDVVHKYPKNISVNMQKYDANSDTLVRLDDSVNGTALQVHINKFREEENLRFMVQMKDIKDSDGNIHLKKGTLTDFKWNYNFIDKSDDTKDIDVIIEKYLK